MVTPTSYADVEASVVRLANASDRMTVDAGNPLHYHVVGARTVEPVRSAPGEGSGGARPQRTSGG